MSTTFPMQPHLKGQLVELRPLRDEDWPALFAVAADPLLWEQHPNPDRWQEEVFREFFRGAMQSGGAFAVLDAKTKAVIGSTRYHAFDAQKSEIEIGWSFLARAYWGGPHNGEMKKLMLDHAFHHVRSVIFVIGPDNTRSRRAVEKIGAVFESSIRNKEGAERVVYRLQSPRNEGVRH